MLCTHQALSISGITWLVMVGNPLQLWASLHLRERRFQGSREHFFSCFWPRWLLSKRASPLIPHGQRLAAKRANTAERVSRAMEGRVGIGFRAKRPGVRGAKCRLADPRPKPRPFRSAGGVSVRSRHPVRHASVALSPAHALPICFQKGLGAGWGVEGVRGR